MAREEKCFGAVEGPLEDRRIDFEGLWFKLRTSKSPFLSSINTHLVPKLGTGRTFAFAVSRAFACAIVD